MKAAVEILQIHAAVTCGLVCALLLGCARRERPYTWESNTIIHPDGTREETRTINRNAIISASGYKLELDKFHVDERFEEGDSNGPGDAHYAVNSDGAKADPNSQLLTGFQAAASLAAQFGGGRLISSPTDQQLSPNDLNDVRALLSELREARERLENKEEP